MICDTVWVILNEELNVSWQHGKEFYFMNTCDICTHRHNKNKVLNKREIKGYLESKLGFLLLQWNTMTKKQVGEERVYLVCNSVLAIPGCQLVCTWNELQSRIGGLTYDPDLEAGRYKFLTWILAWRSWGMVAMKPWRLRQGDLFFSCLHLLASTSVGVY